QGDLTVRSRIKGKDEIGRLAESFDLMLDRINAMIRDITETQERKRKAELAMLQAQINPHFLFNALNSIRMKVMRKGDIESSEMISSLSKLLRMTIDQGRETIPFRKEIDIAKDYIHLMNMRRSTEVQLDIHVSTDAYLEEIPRFILQPIIENSIIHGFSQDGGTISLDAYVEEDVF
ncbi:HAMP domain-containing protein, partial [Klebsiella pneumoniae]